MQVEVERHKKWLETIASMERTRAPWWNTWREISDYFLPRRYPWLLTDKEVRSAGVRNRMLLDSTSTVALRTLATGMMNGITSPTRPWFKLRLSGYQEEDFEPHEQRVWLDEVAKRMLTLMSESNFYNALGVLYLEWASMGTAAMSIYEDADTVFRCYNHAVGEFYIDSDNTGRVHRFARKFARTVEQVVLEFGEENVSANVKADWTAGGVRRQNTVHVWHLVESNKDDPLIRKSAAFREVYWEAGKNDGNVLRVSTTDEFAPITPRWEVYASDVYGSSPCIDAIPDVRQLQQIIKRRAQALDKLVTPPLLVNKMLASKPRSMVPGGETFVAGTDLNQGARPVYQINVPFDQINGDIRDIRERIGITLFNDLFRMISQIDTVRSATEIDARREEKLVLLGPVLERFTDEGLDPALNRIFQICLRAGMFPQIPEGLEENEINVEYVGILADAQRAVGTVSIERYLQLLGNLASMFPEETLGVPNIEEIIRGYADGLGLNAKYQNSREQVQETRAAKAEQESMAQMAQQGQALVGGAQQLSKTDLGGGQNALQAIIGG